MPSFRPMGDGWRRRIRRSCGMSRRAKRPRLRWSGLRVGHRSRSRRLSAITRTGLRSCPCSHWPVPSRWRATQSRFRGPPSSSCGAQIAQSKWLIRSAGQSVADILLCRVCWDLFHRLERRESASGLRSVGGCGRGHDWQAHGGIHVGVVDDLPGFVQYGVHGDALPGPRARRHHHAAGRRGAGDRKALPERILLSSRNLPGQPAGGDRFAPRHLRRAAVSLIRDGRADERRRAFGLSANHPTNYPISLPFRFYDFAHVSHRPLLYAACSWSRRSPPTGLDRSEVR